MSWNSSTKKMTAPVSIKDIKTALVSSKRDIGGLIIDGCTGASGEPINKWSYIKPIHYANYDSSTQTASPKLHLDRIDFRGNPLDNRQCHMVFGLSIPSTDPANYDPDDIHATSWEYVGYPNGPGTYDGNVHNTLTGVSAYRFTDFVDPDNPTTKGYSATALPDLYGTIPDTSVFYYNPNSIDHCASVALVNCGYSETNVSNGGVELAKYVVKQDDVETITDDVLKQRLCKCWPCILIGNYITALSDVTTKRAKTLYTQNGSEYVRNDGPWFVDTFYSSGGVTHKQSCPWSSPQNLPATLLLLYSASGSTPCLLYGDDSTNLDTHWIDLSEDRVWTAHLFPLPGACGETVQISLYALTVANIRVASITEVTSTSVKITVGYAFTRNYTGTVTVSIGGTLYYTPNQQAQGETYPKTYTIGKTFTVENPSGVEDTPSGQITPGYREIIDYTEAGWMPGTFYAVLSITTTVGTSTNAGAGATTAEYVYTTSGTIQ